MNEVEIGNNNSCLTLFDTNSIEFCFPIRSIKSHKDDHFAVASKQNIRLYFNGKESIDGIFDCVAPNEDYFSSFDISPNDTQICAILKHNRKLIFFNEKAR